MYKLLLSISTIFIYTITFAQNVSLSVDSNPIDEGSTAIVTLTSDAVSESDIRLPLTISGSAVDLVDYQKSFATFGEETLITELSAGNFEYFDILEDGRLDILVNYQDTK